jgi:3-carboxy-cis,cis-muconate cycloisomerase
MPQKRNPIGCEYVIAQARGAGALVPQVLAAMAHEHQRGAGPMQLEQLALGQVVLLSHGALSTLLPIAEGLVVDAARMRRNLEAGGGLIMAEAVMMGLAPHLGRGTAHDVVQHACDLALAEGVHLADALARDGRVAAVLDGAALARLTDPAGYLGSAGVFTDAVLARV